MEDISKFEHLLTHWIEHNTSHEESYLNWIRRAEDAGRKDVADEIRQAMELARKISGHFDRAIQLLRGGSRHV